MENIRHEDGRFFSFCPLTCASWLSKRINKSFFLVLGVQSCAYLLESHSTFRMFEDMKFACAVLDDTEISSGIEPASIKPSILEIMQRENPEVIFLVGSCCVEILKIDLKKIASQLTAQTGVPIVPVNLCGLDSVWNQGEDAVLSGLLDFCPQRRGNKGRSVVFLGSIPPETAKDLLEESKRIGIPVGGFLPSARFADLPDINEDTLIAPLYPYLHKTAERIKRLRGSAILNSLFPIGPDGSRVFFEDIGNDFGVPTGSLKGREAETWEQLKKECDILKDKKIFFFGDNMLELPLARFLLRSGAVITETGTPYVHSAFHSKELAILKEAGVPIVEMPNNNEQLRRVQALKPDLLVVPLSLAFPLEMAGYHILWSIKFILPPLHGFSYAGRLLKMFSNSLSSAGGGLDQ
jgi:light-independent protochlorophyllide reductase subunit N